MATKPSPDESSSKTKGLDEHPLVSTPKLSSAIAASPATYITLPTILPAAVLSASRTTTASTLNVPSGIIPLGPSSHHHLVSSSQSYPVAHLTALANLSASLSQSVDSHSLMTPTTAVVIPPPLVTSVTPILPDTPPPPYSTPDVADEYSCSSPSQFLHSPKTIRTTSPTFDRKISPDRQRTSDNTKKLRAKVLNLKKAKAIEMKLNYEKRLQEKFFLEGGGNMMDYQVWRRKPNILKDQYLKQHDLNSDIAVFEELLSPRDPSQVREKLETDALLEQETSLDIDSFSRQPASCDAVCVPTIVLSQTSTNSSFCQPGTPASSVTSPSHSLSLSSPRPALRMHSSLSSVPDVSHEDIVMRARHEAEVMKAISELRKEGLWSTSRLPKVQEPPRFKTHWDFLLEEMRWLATDFANERRWKHNACKKVKLSI